MQMVVGKGYQIESVLIHGELFYDLIQHRVMIATKWKNYKSDFGIGEHMKPGIFLYNWRAEPVAMNMMFWVKVFFY